MSKGLEIANPSGLPQPATVVPRISTTASSERVVRDVEPSDGGTDMIAGWSPDLDSIFFKHLTDFILRT